MKTLLNSLRPRTVYLIASSLVCALVASFMLMGCKSSSSQKDSNAEERSVSKTVEVQLKSNPTTGFSWQCEVEDTSIAELQSSSYKQNEVPEGMVGVGGVETFIFTCKSEGSTKVTFTYLRPWEGGETAEVRNAVLTVSSDGSGVINFN